MANKSTTSTEDWLRERRFAILAFVVCLTVGHLISRDIVSRNTTASRLAAKGLAKEWAADLEVEMSHSISVLDVMATMVRQADGGIDQFQELAPHFVTNFPAVLTLEMQRGGIIEDVYPREGNEAAIGVNLFEHPENAEAVKATRDSGKLTLHGPLTLMQGMEGIAARRPLYFDRPGEPHKFWGFVTAIITLDKIMSRADFGDLKDKGFCYELRRISTRTGRSRVIRKTGEEELVDTVSNAINLPGEDWILHVEPVGGWIDKTVQTVTGLLTLLFSGLLAGLVHYAGRLRASKSRTEALNAELNERGNRFQRLLEAVPDGLVIVNPRGIIEVVNENALKMFGYSRKEMIGQPVEMLVPQGKRAGHPALVQEFFHRSEGHLMRDGREVSAVRKDGSTFPVEVTLGPVQMPGSDDNLVASSVRDITQRRNDEEELRNQQARIEAGEKRFRTVFESSADAVILLGDQTFIDCNTAALEFFQVAAKEAFLQLNPVDLSPEKQPDGLPSLAGIKCRVAEAATSGSARFEWTHMRRDGETFPCEVLLTAMELEGQPVIQGVIRDITERKAAEEAVRRHEAHFRTLFEASNDAVMMIDEDRFYDCNSATLKLFGHSSKETFLGVQPFEISPANQADGTPTADAQQRHLQETMQTGSSRFEWLHRRLNGEDFPCEVLLQKMQLQGKTVVQAVIRDITDRKQAEAEAAQAKEQLQAILDGSPVAMIIARQTDAGPRAVYANQQFNQLTGYSIDESPSFEAFLKLVVPDSGRRHELTRHWRSLSDEAYGKGESIKAFQYEIRTKAGEIRYVSQSSTAVGDRQLIAFNDVTESQLVQAELAKAMKEAEAANQAKSAFLATMSHEIRTPMNAIINMTQLTLGTELNAKQKQYLTVVGYSARGLLALINDILDFSKVEAGKLDLETTPFSLRQLLDEVTDSFRGRVMEKQIEFVVHAEGNVPDRLIGDTLRLRQVLINLVGNAFKFTEDGEVILRIALVDPAASKTDGGPVQLRIGVKDSGIGISKEGQSKLFQSFSQVDASTPRKYGGTGLGLAICQKLVELMGGRLAVVSEEGEGSEFFFTGDFGCESWATTQRKLPDGIKDLQVLAIDDNDSTRELIKTVVEGFGMSCETAPDGADGLELLRQRNVENKDGRPFDLVVVDWIMPEMDGLEFCKAMRQQPATAGIPLIMISAFAGKAEEDKAKLFGVSAFIHKPLTASHLFDAFVGLYDNTHTASSYRDQKEDDEPVRADEFAGVRILMAEDNDANQFVAQEILEAVGFKLDIADNGRIAVEKLGECDEYTLVLMDMQMPEMDGLTATKEIRKRWPDRKLPIIALTANAMKGDLERCMEAGMDDYVSKPIDSKLLFKALRRWVPSNAPRATASEPDKAAEPAVETEEIPVVEGIDINDAIARLGLPWVSIRKMLFRFADGQPETLKELQAAMTSKDSEAARRHAHSIAGAGGNLSAIELRKRAKALELAIKDDTGGTEELFKSMNEELERVLGAINAIRPAPEAVAEPTNDQPVDAAALTEALGKLKTALEEGDMDGIESEAATCAKLGVPPALRRDMAKIGSLIEQYDYVTAAEVAERLIGHIKE